MDNSTKDNLLLLKSASDPYLTRIESIAEAYKSQMGLEYIEKQLELMVDFLNDCGESSFALDNLHARLLECSLWVSIYKELQDVK